MGSLEPNTTDSSTLSREAPRDAYLYRGEVGDTILVTADYEGIGSPLIIIFDVTTQVPVAFSQPEASGAVSLSFVLPAGGDYLITVTAFEFLGQEFGYGDYTLEFELR